MASCADDATLGHMVEYLLVDTDNTGVNEHLVMLMLDERRDHPVAHTTAIKVRQRQEARLLGNVVEALCHPFVSLREAATQQMLHLGLDITSVADKLQMHMRTTQDDWFRSVNLMTSLIQLRQNGVDKLHQHDIELAEAIKDSLLSNGDMDVVSAAAAGLGALGVRNGRLIFALFDILDQGHRELIKPVAKSTAQLGVSWNEICSQLMSRLKGAAEGGASGAVMMGRGSTIGESPGGKLEQGFSGTKSNVRMLGAEVETNEVSFEWIEVAQALGDAGPDHAEEVMDSLQDILVHPDTVVAVEGAVAFGKIGLEHYVLEWCFERLEEGNDAATRRSALACLVAMAEHFPSMQSIDAFCSFVKDPDTDIAATAAAALPKVAKALDDDDAVVGAVVALLNELAAQPDKLMLAAEALAALLPPAADASTVGVDVTELLTALDLADDWTTVRRAADCMVKLAPAVMVDRLLGWLSGDAEQMPNIYHMDPKQVQIEVCHLIGNLKTTRSEVEGALLACLLQCTEDISAADVGVAAVQSLPHITGGRCTDDVCGAFAQILELKETAFPDDPTAETLLMVLHTAALTALGSMQPPQALASALGRFLVDGRPGADLLWEPAGKALHTCRSRDPDAPAVKEAIQIAQQNFEWILKTKKDSTVSEDKAWLSHAAAAMVALELKSDVLGGYLVRNIDRTPQSSAVIARSVHAQDPRTHPDHPSSTTWLPWVS